MSNMPEIGTGFLRRFLVHMSLALFFVTDYCSFAAMYRYCDKWCQMIIARLIVLMNYGKMAAWSKLLLGTGAGLPSASAMFC